uniref:Uncharacterized protein n=1 Tax=Anguilla anguilla TaxID=7936 RepID=A0A0E9V8G6_ANGAN
MSFPLQSEQQKPCPSSDTDQRLINLIILYFVTVQIVVTSWMKYLLFVMFSMS